MRRGTTILDHGQNRLKKTVSNFFKNFFRQFLLLHFMALPGRPDQSGVGAARSISALGVRLREGVGLASASYREATSGRGGSYKA